MVPTAVGVCSEAISIEGDGSVGPLFCGSDAYLQQTGMDTSFPVNSQAWAELLSGNGGLFALGAAASESTVLDDICTNPEGTFPITSSAFYIADAYYGRGYPDLSQYLVGGGC